MLEIQRRRGLGLIAGAFSAIVMPAGASVSAANLINGYKSVKAASCSGAVFARETRTAHEAKVDLWTARVSDFDMLAMPEGFNRVVIWDDLFRLNEVHETCSSIIDAMPGYYGFDCRGEADNLSFYFSDINTLDDAISSIVGGGGNAPIALVDLDSCGVTTLNWEQVLPRIQGHYDVVVGVLCGAPESFGWFEEVEESGSFFCPSSLQALDKCDFAILKSHNRAAAKWISYPRSRAIAQSESLSVVAAVETWKMANDRT